MRSPEAAINQYCIAFLRAAVSSQPGEQGEPVRLLYRCVAFPQRRIAAHRSHLRPKPPPQRRGGRFVSRRFAAWHRRCSAPARVAAVRRLIAAVAVIAVIAGIPVMGMPPVAAPGVLTPFIAAPPFAPLAVMTPTILLGLGWSGSRQRRDDSESGEGCDGLTHGFLHRMRLQL